MKIGILTNSYPPNLNGVSVAVANLEKALIALGHEVFVVTPQVPNVNYAENVLPVQSYSAPQHASGDLRLPYNFVTQTVKFFKDKQIEILHSQDTLVGGVEAVIIAMKLQVPCVHTYHTMVEDYDYFKFPGYRVFIRNYSQIVCDGHEAVVAVSAKTQDYLQKIGVSTPIVQIPNVLQMHPKAVEQIKNLDQQVVSKLPNNQLDLLNKNNPENYSDFNSEAALAPKSLVPTSQSIQSVTAKNELTVNSKSESLLNLAKIDNLQQTFNFLTFGRIAKEKSLDLGLEVLTPILKKYPNTRYLIAGMGPEINNLQKLIYQAGLSRQVFLLGCYTAKDLAEICSVCHVFVNTSSSENLPTTDFEALSFGLPLVTIDDPAHQFFVNSFSLQNLAAKTSQSQTFINNEKKPIQIVEKNNLSHHSQITTNLSFSGINYQSQTSQENSNSTKKQLDLAFENIKKAPRSSWQLNDKYLNLNNLPVNSNADSIFANGFWLPLPQMTEACEQLYLKPDLWTKLSRGARLTAQKLAARLVATEYLELYKRLISQNQKKVPVLEQIKQKTTIKPFLNNFTKMNENLENYWQKWRQEFKAELKDMFEDRY